jgi:cytochrome c oxidase assembly protein subunit 11
MEVHPGQLYETHFHARNKTNRHITGQAVPSVAPGLAAQHFKKIECFCFTQQMFMPDEGRDMGVTFLIDPELPAHLDTLTLSYTLYALPDNE